jgi:lipoprotein NlpI
LIPSKGRRKNVARREEVLIDRMRNGCRMTFTGLEKSSKKQLFVSIRSSSAPAPIAEQKDARRHYIRALAYTGKGLKDEARAEFAGAASISPSDARYRYFLEAGSG